MIRFVEIDKGDIKLRLYDSFKPYRLKKENTGETDETQEEYRLRQKTIKRFIKQRKNTKHVSSTLIPALDNLGNMIYNDKGAPVFLGRSKGVTYKKDDKESHMKLVDHFKNLKDKKDEQ